MDLNLSIYQLRHTYLKHVKVMRSGQHNKQPSVMLPTRSDDDEGLSAMLFAPVCGGFSLRGKVAGICCSRSLPSPRSRPHA